MSATKETILLLKREIEKNMILSESGRHFLPEVSLKSIFTIPNIERAVSELPCPIQDRVGLPRKIVGDSMRLFAILIKHGEEHNIVILRENGISDKTLPLSEEHATQILGPFGISFAMEYQWQFLPFEFRKEMSEYSTTIYEKKILPFIGSPNRSYTNGGFGDVSGVQICPLLQEFMPHASKEVYVVRKTIRIRQEQSNEDYKQAFRNEVSCLILLNRLEHPNIIPLLASYSHGSEHNLLFPAFDMDLEKFLGKQTRFGRFELDTTFYSALNGLASALLHTHDLHLEKERHGFDFDYIGYHHDLRPANVLVSPETFILADFGLGKFKPANLPSQTPWKFGTDDYLAPECMGEDFSRQIVGRAIDVWAFGCLVIEVMIYMKEGISSLEKFRKSRLQRGRYERLSDRFFFGENGIIKTEVQSWLTRLVDSVLTASPDGMLLKLAGRALKRHPQDRPKMADLCIELTFISLKAHFLAVCSSMREYVEASTHHAAQSEIGMSLCFQQERFIAFGHVLGLHSNLAPGILTQSLKHLQNDIQNVMTSLNLQFKQFIAQQKTDRDDRLEDIPDSSFQVQALESRVCQSVEILWKYLPAGERREAEASWIRAMLKNEEPRYLQRFQHSLELQDDPAYDKVAAMAMMKRVRLEIDSESSELPKRFVLSHTDIRVGKSIQGHTMGLFKMTTPVLVEWMYYSPTWKSIPPHERTLAMALKAQGFGLQPKSPIILDCIGTFENTGKREGYGFVYKLPGLHDNIESSDSIVTLLQLLNDPQKYLHESERPPNLRERFGLASSLASFLDQFHGAGWLHKDFNSNNVLFVKTATEGDRDGNILPILARPFVVGLNKSRPDGDRWHTQGLASGDILQEYRHPEYVRTNRYRAGYDYYGLGLILLEIGLWRPLRFWSERYSTMSLAELRQKLLTTYVPRLGAQMGGIYRGVTQFCLSIHSGNIQRIVATVEAEHREEATDDFATIYQNVIEPLYKLGELTI